MNSLLFLIAGAVVLVLVAKKDSATLHQALPDKKPHSQYLPKAISMLIVTAQISELIKVIEHVSIVNTVAALLLMAVIIATKSGTED